MFTGLIEDIGKVVRWQNKAKAGRLTFSTRLSSRAMPLGASIAVNGTCLTVISKSQARLIVDVSPETLARTNFQDVDKGHPVNLERPLRFSDRLGGHLVTGHVDGVGTIKEITRRGEFTFFQVRVPVSLMRLIVVKGSIAIDGISLTVNDCARGLFSVAIIPFSMKHTNLQSRRVGDKVNIETDLIGKYVQNLLKSGGLR
jgi:riboflavin synthase